MGGGGGGGRLKMVWKREEAMFGIVGVVVGDGGVVMVIGEV